MFPRSTNVKEWLCDRVGVAGGSDREGRHDWAGCPQHEQPAPAVRRSTPTSDQLQPSTERSKLQCELITLRLAHHIKYQLAETRQRTRQRTRWQARLMKALSWRLCTAIIAYLSVSTFFLPQATADEVTRVPVRGGGPSMRVLQLPPPLRAATTNSNSGRLPPHLAPRISSHTYSLCVGPPRPTPTNLTKHSHHHLIAAWPTPWLPTASSGLNGSPPRPDQSLHHHHPLCHINSSRHQAPPPQRVLLMMQRRCRLASSAAPSFSTSRPACSLSSCCRSLAAAGAIQQTAATAAATAAAQILQSHQPHHRHHHHQQ